MPKYIIHFDWYHKRPDWKVGQADRMNQYTPLESIAVGLVHAMQHKSLSSHAKNGEFIFPLVSAQAVCGGHTKY